jgi:outer membrane protein assembly factor BamB
MDRRVFNRACLLSATASLTINGISPLISACQANDISAASWPCWRGPSRDGQSPTNAWPLDFKSLEKLWSVELGDSYSGPIVADNRVFTTESIDGRDEALTALDVQTGQQLWKRSWPGAMSVPFFAKSNGDWIRSTPATADQRIVVGGMRDVLTCFASDTGDELWRVDFAARYQTELPAFGTVCSPLIDDQDLYIQAGGGVRKLRMADGETVWLALEESGGMSGGAFSSPVIATLHGQRQLIVQTRSQLAGLDLNSGKVLWSRQVASFRGMNILTPTIWNDCVFTSSYGGKSQLIGFVPGSDSWATELKWEGKAEAYMSSPVIVADHLYLHLRNQRLCCVDLQSGQETWRTTPFGKYWSMLTNANQILALDERGELLLLQANPLEYQLLDRQTLSSEPSWAHVALVGEQLFVRRQRGLDAYRWGS